MREALLQLARRALIASVPALMVGIIASFLLPNPLAVLLGIATFAFVFFRERIAASPYLGSVQFRLIVGAAVLLPLYIINPILALIGLLIIIFAMALIGAPQVFRTAWDWLEDRLGFTT